MSEEDLQASLVAATVAVIAESGYQAASLESVAERAGVSAGQLFPDRATLIAVTMGWMYGDLGHYVGSRVEAAPDGLPKIAAYIRSMNKYFFEKPAHLRVMGEVLASGDLAGAPGERPRERRWQALADLLAAGQREGLLGAFDPRAVAIVIGGAIDGLIAEWVADSEFDLLGATEELVSLVSGLTGGAAFL